MNNELKITLITVDEKDIEQIIESKLINVIGYELKVLDVPVADMKICDIKLYHIINGEETISNIMMDLTERTNTKDVQWFIDSYIIAAHNNRVLRLYGSNVEYPCNPGCIIFKLRVID